MLTNHEQALITKTMHKEKLFLSLSIASVVIGLSLAAYYVWKTYAFPEFTPGIHFVVVILVLLNARQNLRQYFLARILAKLHYQQPEPTL